MYSFRRTIKVRAVKLGPESMLVKAGVASLGSWLVFEDGRETVIPHAEFVEAYSASGDAAAGYLAMESKDR